MIEARTFQTALWNFIIGQQEPQSLEVRLRWFRDRYLSAITSGVAKNVT